MLLNIANRIFLKKVAKINNCNKKRNAAVEQTAKPVNTKYVTIVESKTSNHNYSTKKYIDNRQ